MNIPDPEQPDSISPPLSQFPELPSERVSSNTVTVIETEEPYNQTYVLVEKQENNQSLMTRIGHRFRTAAEKIYKSKAVRAAAVIGTLATAAAAADYGAKEFSLSREPMGPILYQNFGTGKSESLAEIVEKHGHMTRDYVANVPDAINKILTPIIHFEVGYAFSAFAASLILGGTMAYFVRKDYHRRRKTEAAVNASPDVEPSVSRSELATTVQ